VGCHVDGVVGCSLAETLVEVPGRQRLLSGVRPCLRGVETGGGAVGGGRADILLGPEAISAAGTPSWCGVVGLLWWIPAVVDTAWLVWVGRGVWWGFGVG
jgi:hypothetical protein